MASCYSSKYMFLSFIMAVWIIYLVSVDARHVPLSRQRTNSRARPRFLVIRPPAGSGQPNRVVVLTNPRNVPRDSESVRVEPSRAVMQAIASIPGQAKSPNPSTTIPPRLSDGGHPQSAARRKEASRTTGASSRLRALIEGRRNQARAATSHQHRPRISETVPRAASVLPTENRFGDLNMPGAIRAAILRMRTRGRTNGRGNVRESIVGHESHIEPPRSSSKSDHHGHGGHHQHPHHGHTMQGSRRGIERGTVDRQPGSQRSNVQTSHPTTQMSRTKPETHHRGFGNMAANMASSRTTGRDTQKGMGNGSRIRGSGRGNNIERSGLERNRLAAKSSGNRQTSQIKTQNKLVKPSNIINTKLRTVNDSASVKASGSAGKIGVTPAVKTAGTATSVKPANVVKPASKPATAGFNITAKVQSQTNNTQSNVTSTKKIKTKTIKMTTVVKGGTAADIAAAAASQAELANAVAQGKEINSSTIAKLSAPATKKPELPVGSITVRREANGVSVITLSDGVGKPVVLRASGPVRIERIISPTGKIQFLINPVTPAPPFIDPADMEASEVEPEEMFTTTAMPATETMFPYGEFAVSEPSTITVAPTFPPLENPTHAKLGVEVPVPEPETAIVKPVTNNKTNIEAGAVPLSEPAMPKTTSHPIVAVTKARTAMITSAKPAASEQLKTAVNEIVNPNKAKSHTHMNTGTPSHEPSAHVKGHPSAISKVNTATKSIIDSGASTLGSNTPNALGTVIREALKQRSIGFIKPKPQSEASSISGSLGINNSLNDMVTPNAKNSLQNRGPVRTDVTNFIPLPRIPRPPRLSHLMFGGMPGVVNHFQTNRIPPTQSNGFPSKNNKKGAPQSPNNVIKAPSDGTNMSTSGQTKGRVNSVGPASVSYPVTSPHVTPGEIMPHYDILPSTPSAR